MSLVTNLRRAVRRLRRGEPIVVVSGLPRSGTSMVMSMLAAGGVPIVTDGKRRSDDDNPRGYFEDDRVLDLASQSDKLWLRQARGKAIKVISHLLRELPDENDYQVLFLVRDLREVLASQAKMLTRRGETADSSDERMTELFEDELWKARSLLKREARFESLEIEYARVVADPAAEARRIADFLAATVDVAAMSGSVDRDLYRNRA